MIRLDQCNVIAILREYHSHWERRTPLTPQHVALLVQQGKRVLVQPSDKRCYQDYEYEQAGALLSEDTAEAQVLLGV